MDFLHAISGEFSFKMTRQARGVYSNWIVPNRRTVSRLKSLVSNVMVV